VTIHQRQIVIGGVDHLSMNGQVEAYVFCSGAFERWRAMEFRRLTKETQQVEKAKPRDQPEINSPHESLVLGIVSVFVFEIDTTCILTIAALSSAVFPASGSSSSARLSA
jgi:hypothetical protein